MEVAERDLGGNEPPVRAFEASTRGGAKPDDCSDAPAVRYSAEFAALLQAARPSGHIDWISVQPPRRRAQGTFGSMSDYFQLVAVAAIALVAAFGTAYWPINGRNPLAAVEDRESTKVAVLPKAAMPAADVDGRDVDIPLIGGGLWLAAASKSDPVLQLFPLTLHQAFAPSPAVSTIAMASGPATVLSMAPSTGSPASVVSIEDPPSLPNGEAGSASLQVGPGSIRPADKGEPKTAGDDSTKRPDVNTASGSTNGRTATADTDGGTRASARSDTSKRDGAESRSTGREGQNKDKGTGGETGKGDKGKGGSGKGHGGKGDKGGGDKGKGDK